MGKNLKVDEDYLNAYNLGYELAKELNLKTSLLKNLENRSEVLRTIISGIDEYIEEKEVKINKAKIYVEMKSKGSSQKFKSWDNGIDFSS